jgi:hypothetical protein
MLQAFIDDSTSSGEVLILAGYIANVEQWLGFTSRWQQALTLPPEQKIFKMRDLDMKNPVHVEKVLYHYRIIEEYIPLGFCVAMPHKPLAKVCQELNVKKEFRAPFYMGWILLISALRKLHTDAGWNGAVELIFDEQKEKRMILHAWDIIVEKMNGDTLPIKNTPMFRTDEEYLPLQAADLLAWWARKAWVKSQTWKGDATLFPWENSVIRPDYLFFEVNEEGLRKHIMSSIASA